MSTAAPSPISAPSTVRCSNTTIDHEKELPLAGGSFFGTSYEFDKEYTMGRGSALFGPQKGYKVVLKCTQAATAAPAIAYVLESSHPLITVAGDVTIARTSAGLYTFTCTGAFTANKTVAKVTSNNASGRVAHAVYTSADVLTLQFFDLGATPAAADSDAFDLEIFVYTV
jgi:hypothetical protein